MVTVTRGSHLGFVGLTLHHVPVLYQSGLCSQHGGLCMNSRCCTGFDSFTRLMRPSQMSQRAARFFLIQQSPSQQADVCHRLVSDQRQKRDGTNKSLSLCYSYSVSALRARHMQENRKPDKRGNKCKDIERDGDKEEETDQRRGSVMKMKIHLCVRNKVLIIHHVTCWDLGCFVLATNTKTL